jgi:peptidoglycan hydrolase FlgJ
MNDIRVLANPGSAPSPAEDRDALLKKTAKQLEGVFVEHLFKAMRETVPDGGLTDGGSGEEVFTSLLDRHFADLVPNAWDRGLSSALYRQLRTVTSESGAADTTPRQERGD